MKQLLDPILDTLESTAKELVTSARREGTIIADKALLEEIDLSVRDRGIFIGGAAATGPIGWPLLGARYGEQIEEYERYYEEGVMTKGDLENIRIETKTPAPVAVALANSPEEFVQRARKRVRQYFVLQLVVAITVSVILLTAIAGAVVFALIDRGGVAVTLGGIGVADLIATYLYQPIGKLYGALVTSQKLELELVIMQLWVQIGDCKEHKELRDRIRCTNRVWKEIHKELDGLPA